MDLLGILNLSGLSTPYALKLFRYTRWCQCGLWWCSKISILRTLNGLSFAFYKALIGIFLFPFVSPCFNASSNHCFCNRIDAFDHCLEGIAIYWVLAARLMLSLQTSNHVKFEVSTNQNKLTCDGFSHFRLKSSWAWDKKAFTA